MNSKSNRQTAPNAPPARLWNGRYEVQITPAGTGHSACGGIALNRWSADPVEDTQGFFIYLRDCDSGEFWSPGALPAPAADAEYRVEAGSDSVGFRCARADITASLEIALAPKHPLEIRRLHLSNTGARSCRLEVTSFLEVVLLNAAADADHPAFVKLFVQTEFDKARQALLANRRPRSREESWPWLAHGLVGAEVCGWETDRLRFIGRNRSAMNPVVLDDAEVLSGTVGNVLDCSFSLRARLEIPAGETRELSFLLGLAEERAGALALMERFGDPHLIAECFCGLQVRSPLPVSVRQRVDASPASPGPDPGLGGTGLNCFNGYGGFSEDGSEYVIRLPWDGRGLKHPPLPWINVIANERCGMLISESGAAHTWCRNSQANRLTPWSNDPVGDPHGEALYLRDEATGVFWPPLPGPSPAPCAHEVRHGFGCSRFLSKWNGLENEMTFFVPQDVPGRIALWRVTNISEKPHELSLFCYQRLVLGSLPSPRGKIFTSCDDETRTLLATHPSSGDFADGIVFAFAHADGGKSKEWSFTCDREGFLGPHGSSVAQPEALQSGGVLDGRCGADLDACFAQRLRICLEAGQSMECAFFLGEALSEAEWRSIVQRFRVPGAVRVALDEARRSWGEKLGGIRVETPVPAIDLMVNGWLAYQAISCRIWARTAFYQSSGAYGFRDQLQDASNLVFLWPELTRSQILLHAHHQFVEGDVLHWWHPAPIARGLRTRFSDDLLWLPYATAYYLRVTGDTGLLDEEAPFLQAAMLEPGEDERYLKPEVSQDRAGIYEHCCRALDRSLTKGAHGLPLMGTGDWNDGMNRVGREGRGESVWLGFFLFNILEDFLPICERRGDRARLEHYAAYRETLHVALEATGWDGAWYRRAYYDDGTPLGTHDAAECRIDGLAQSWAVISHAAARERASQAMDAVEDQLVSEEDGIIRLLTPAFVHAKEDPGYIKGYVAGVRENGGQYTHAACWVVKALAELGRNARAAKLLERLLPVWHGRSQEAAELYKVEPYVIAADIYGEPPHVGRGGWTWYTGSAGWAYRVALESVLGFSVLEGRVMAIRPCVPDDWDGYRVTYRHPVDGTLIELSVANPTRRARTVVSVEVDGLPVLPVGGAAQIPIRLDGGVHHALVTLG